jgi:S1-C subfamily serine protease
LTQNSPGLDRDSQASHDLQVGQSVFAIGNPFGPDQTLTTGIVSALGRETSEQSGRSIKGVIQIDVAINDHPIESSNELFAVQETYKVSSG